MRLLLTRHGQTDWNIVGKIQGQTDIELNETGIKQAEETREKLAKEKIDVIISSPQKRAKRTAEIIARGRKIPIIIDKQYEDAESVGELFTRVQRFLEKIKEEYKDRTVLLVTHGGVCVPIRATLEGIPKGMEVLRGLGLENCEVKEYEL